jgi:Zn-dependent protease
MAEETGGRKLRGIVAVVGVFLLTLAGAAVDSFVGIGLGTITLITLVGSTVLATLLVRRRDLLSMVVAPPLVFTAVAAVNIALAPSASANLATIATLLVRGFPTMAIATVVALVLALVRWATRR